jgi:hypothetical protein
LAEEAKLREELQRMTKAEFVQHYNVLVQDLKRRGYSEQAIRKVLAEQIADPKEEKRWVYRCPKCGRTVEKTYPGRYFCAVCGPSAIMEPVKPEQYETRGFGAPRSDVERVMRHYGVSREEAERLISSRGVEALLPSRGTRVVSSPEQTPQTEVPAEPMEFIRGKPWMHGVWSMLELDKTLTSTTKNVLWQDFVAAWNRRGLLTNEEAELAIKARFG